MIFYESNVINGIWGRKTMAERNKRIELKVEDVERTDLAKGIARIDQAAMQILQISERDIIEIIGNKKTVARVHLANPEDAGKNIVRIDAYTRRNAGTTVGGYVKICKADVVEAKKIFVAPSGIPLTVDDLLVKFLKSELSGRPLMKMNIIVVVMLAHPVLFVVTDTEPDGPVVFTENTELRVLSKLSEVSE